MKPVRVASTAFSLCLSAVLCAAPQDVDARISLLMRATDVMRKALRQMRNYACSEKITREISSESPSRLEYRDRLRLDVTVIAGAETFSWPGAAAFEAHSPADLVSTGAVTIGDFANFAQAVFGSDAPTYSYGKDDVRAGKPVVCYDYRVPLAKSDYTIRSAGGAAVVAYHGSFWVDPETAQVLALEVIADAIPERIRISEVRTIIEYKSEGLGSFVVPATSELTAEHWSGQRAYNRIEFSDCRRYAGESTVRFEDASLPEAPPAAVPALELPVGLRVEIALNDPIDFGTSSAGDLLAATVARPLRAGKVQIPAGAKLFGRLLRCEMDFAERQGLVVIDFHELTFENTRAKFHGRLRNFEPKPGLASPSKIPEAHSRFGLMRTSRQKESAIFLLQNGLTRIDAGFRMSWQTTRGD